MKFIHLTTTTLSSLLWVAIAASAAQLRGGGARNLDEFTYTNLCITNEEELLIAISSTTTTNTNASPRPLKLCVDNIDLTRQSIGLTNSRFVLGCDTTKLTQAANGGRCRITIKTENDSLGYPYEGFISGGSNVRMDVTFQDIEFVHGMGTKNFVDDELAGPSYYR